MTFKQFFLLIAVATGCMWLGWLWTLFTIDPEKTNAIGFTLFFGTLFLSFFGTVSLVSLWWRQRKEQQAAVFQLVEQSFRQGLLLSLFFIWLLLLLARDWFTPFTLAGSFIVLIIFEYLVLHKGAKKQRRSTHSDKESIQQKSGDDFVPAPQFVTKSIGEAAEADEQEE